MSDTTDNGKPPRRASRRRAVEDDGEQTPPLLTFNMEGPAAPTGRDEVVDLLEFGIMQLPLDREMKLICSLLERGISARVVADRLGYDRAQLLRLIGHREISDALRAGQETRRNAIGEIALDDSLTLYSELYEIAMDGEVPPKVRRDAIKDIMEIGGVRGPGSNGSSGVTVNVIQQQRVDSFNQRVEDIRRQHAVVVDHHKRIAVDPTSETE
jgi:hypothetical protein